MILHLIIFLISLVLLAKGADYFVEYAGRIAKRLGVSDFIIGLTLTSIGTSIPELAASISASINGASGLVMGNVIGSNIANIGLILGVSALIRSFTTEEKMYERDGFIMMASTILLFAFAYDNFISTIEAGIMLIAYSLYILFLIKSDQESRAYHFQDFMSYVFDFQYISPLKNRLFQSAIGKPKKERTTVEKQTVDRFKLGLFKDLGITLSSGLAIMFGAKYLIEEALWLAGVLSIPESIVGISLVAVGTSLPELSVSISAVRKGKGEMVVGNIVGSNIANILLIIGVSGLIKQMNVSEISVVYTIPHLIFFTIALLYFIKSDWTIHRSQGIMAIIAYVAFIAMAFIMGWS